MSTGNIFTVAGTGVCGYTGNGLTATSSKLYDPYGIALDSGGNLYIGDVLNYRVRAVVLGSSYMPAIAWSAPAAITYGTALSSTQLDATTDVPSTCTYSPALTTVLTAGTKTLSVTCTPTDTSNYVAGTATVSLTVNKATLTVTANNASRVYDTANPTLTASYSGFVNGDTQSVLSGSPTLTTLAGTSSTVAGYTITAAAGTLTASNYTFSFVNGTLTVNQATPTITWSTPSPIAYGTALSSTQLDASLSVAGMCNSYNPASGAVLSIGTQTLFVTCTPTDTIDYTSPIQANVSLIVDKATPNIVWATPANVPPGTTLGATQLNASVNGVVGTFTYSPQSGTLLNSEGWYPITASFVPQDTADYTTATDTVTLTVSMAPNAGTMATVAGDGVAGYTGDGNAAIDAELNGGSEDTVSAVAVDSVGNLYIADTSNNAVRKVTAATGVITTVAGNAPTSTLASPSGIAVDSSGNIYIADSGEAELVEVSASSGDLTTVAGTPPMSSPEYTGDGGPAANAQMGLPVAVTIDSSGNIYIADELFNVVRAIYASGTLPNVTNPRPGDIYTVAGNGTSGFSGDNGSATSAELCFSTTSGTVVNLIGAGVAVDSQHNLYIADTCNNRIRVVSASTGKISTFAGSTAVGYSGDGGPAMSAALFAPQGVAVDNDDNVYIADTNNCVVRRVTASNGIIATIAGNGIYGYFGDGGPAVDAEMTNVSGVALDASSNVYIADPLNFRVRMLDASSDITWPTPAPIAYGTPLSSTQLNATSSVTGTFSYDPPMGTVLTAGSQTLSATFTPADSANFSPFTATVQLNVVQATPSISWSTPSAIVYGTALSGSQLNATSSIPGSFTYSPLSGQVLNPGPNTLTATFTPSDTADYSTTTAQVTLMVSDESGSTYDTGTATLTVNGATAASVSYGQGSTPSSIAAQLASAAASDGEISVTAVDNALYIQSATQGGSTNYSYAVAISSSNSFSPASFSATPASGNFYGGETQNLSSAVIYSYETSYDGVGNLQNYSDSVNANPNIAMGSWQYSYDTLNRLTGATDNQPNNPSTNYCWGYDPFGNRIIQSGSAGVFTVASPVQPGQTPCQPQSGVFVTDFATPQSAANTNQLANTSLATSGIVYDASGNVLNDGTNQYLYDADGRICAVSNSPLPTVTVMTGYIYNADGERVAKGNITSWSCDPSVNGFQTMSDYVVGLNGEQVTEMAMDSNNNMVWQHTNVWAGGELLATYDTNGLHFYFNDALGTRRAQTDSNGVLEQTCFNLPFGDSLDCTQSAEFPTEHHFTGKERDSESGNDYFGARYYASSMGRWTSPDPSGLLLANPANPQALNLYSYVGNNPLRFFDPDGLDGVDPAATQGWLLALLKKIGHFFSGGGGDAPPPSGPSWQPTPPTRGHYVTVGFYPAGASWIGGHIGVGLDTPNDTYGWATVNKHPFVLYLTGYPFAGQLKKDRTTYKDRMSGLAAPRYLYMPISDDEDEEMKSAIGDRDNLTDPSKDVGNYDLYFRNCAQFVEDVLHAGGVRGVPHKEVFMPRGLRLLLLLESHLPH
jgi:RHS repeat-associated protein